MRLANSWIDVDRLVRRSLDLNCQRAPWKEAWCGLWDQVGFKTVWKVVKPLTWFLREINNADYK